MVVKIDIESMLDKSGFGAATEMGGFSLDKVPYVSLAPEYFCVSIFTSSASLILDAKQSISTIFPLLVP